MLNPFNKRLKKSSKRSISPEQHFWNWFADHKSEIEEFIDSAERDYTTLKRLTNAIKRYSYYLFPELAKSDENKYILVVTPDGIRDGVEPTKKLVNDAPEIENWIIHRFRQPSDDITIEMNGQKFPTSIFQLVPNINYESEKVDLQVFIDAPKSQEKVYQHIAFLYFDHILGEFNTITRVGTIDFYTEEKLEPIQGAISFLELRVLIEKELY